jgi:hypothetical protein
VDLSLHAIKHAQVLTVLDFKIVDKLDGVPAIHDSVVYAQ